MKKFLFVFAALVMVAGFAMAQSYQEVVYLKNGSVIRGVVIEQVPGVSLKVQTSDGSIFAYPMSDVEKITKEVPVTTQYKAAASLSSNGLVRGYRGFVDAGYSVGVGDGDGADFAAVTTSHGYQFNRYIFLGGGVGAHYYYDAELVSFPIFVNFRTDFVDAKASPFVDVKGGYSVGDVEGPFAGLSAGVRVSLKNSKALNISIGYAEQGVESYYYYSDSDWEWFGAVTLRFGFEF
ncbi:MAG: hypothetical protein Q4A18_02185 [Rikenellaceae bacterium]|nr:hypothetical protein [Rikenellaceae bacterium]